MQKRSAADEIKNEENKKKKEEEEEEEEGINPTYLCTARCAASLQGQDSQTQPSPVADSQQLG